MKLFKNKDEKVLMKVDTPVLTGAEYARMSPEALIAFTIDRAKNINVEVMERLMAMRDRMKAEKAKESYFRDLAAFQNECPIIKKTKMYEGEKISVAYAPIEDIIPIAGPLLKKYGFGYTWDATYEPATNKEDKFGAQVVTCTLHHKEGHEEKSTFRAPIDSKLHVNDIQKQAASITYAKRYTLCAVAGIIVGGEDTDGGGDARVTKDQLDEYRQAINELALNKTVTSTERKQIEKQAAETGTVPALRALWKHWNNEIKDRKAVNNAE